MDIIKIGDIVARTSYDKDILFIVEKINDQKMAMLKGLTIRIQADSNVEDLEIVGPKLVKEYLKRFDQRIDSQLRRKSRYYQRMGQYRRAEPIKGSGTILHLDGDKRYSEKSNRYYSSVGLNAIVKNINENRQVGVILPYLEKYNPDILVITGHDGMIKKGKNFNDVYNYQNSRYFIQAVMQARKWDRSGNLVIFAGACQSYYEGIMAAGANFASSPARILIDFMDPLIVAQKIAITNENRYITIDDIKDELRDGTKGVDGIGGLGKRRFIY